jgi:hypothetical protein
MMSTDIWISIATATVSTAILMAKMTYDKRHAVQALKEVATVRAVDAGVIKEALEDKAHLVEQTLKEVQIDAKQVLDEQVQVIKSIVEQTAEVTQEKADKAYHEANSVNVKIEKLYEHFESLKKQQMTLAKMFEESMKSRK